MNTVAKFLMHYGVKGMQWGVRKDRKEIKANFAREGALITGRQHVRSMQGALSETTYASLSDKDFVVGRDAVIRRTTRDLSGDNQQKNTYVTINDNDAAIYRGFFPARNIGVRKKYDGDYYESTYKATEQLKSPSEKKRVDAYIQLMDKPEIKLTTGETVTGREYLKQAGLGNAVDKLSSKELALTYYGQLAMSQGMHDEVISKAYFNNLRAKGYNAVVDDNDAGIFSTTPILVLDSYKNLERVNVKRLTTEEIHTAQATLKAPKERYW